jgi:kanamycin nucleotidyltransferase
MDHEERIGFAQTLCDRFANTYKEAMIIGGVYGSTAKGSDRKWSDLEMLFIVTDECDARGQHFLYRGIAVSYYVLKHSKLEGILRHPCLQGDMGWPFWMGVLSVLKVLYGDRSRIDTWLDMGRSVPDMEFNRALRKELPGLVTESYGRILSCKDRNNMDDWYCAVLEVLFEIRDALCLLNKKWVTHNYYQSLVDTFQFKKLPQRYIELVPVLWHVRNIDEAVARATELVKNFWQLMADQGFDTGKYNDVSDITL